MPNVTVLFNQNVKDDYLSKFQENTRETYTRIFEKSSELEYSWKKDLFNFNVAEIEHLLYELKPTTPVSARVAGRIVSSYLGWAVEKGLRHNKHNPLSMYGQEWFDQFVINAILYITEQELRDLEGFCANAQDAVVFRLIFEGVYGKAYSELSNLKRSDVNYNSNILTLTDSNGSKRQISVTDRCIALIERANRQQEYIKNNGDVEHLPRNVSPVIKLVGKDESPYVLRNALTRREDFSAPASKDTIVRRIDAVRDWFGGEYIINAKNIQKSGMLWTASQQLKENGEINMEKIAVKYGFKNVWSTKSWVNKDNLKLLYNIEEVK